MDYLVQGYIALGVSASLMGLWNLGRAFRRAGNPSEEHYRGLPAKAAARRRESDAKLVALLDDAADHGIPVSVVAGVFALLAVPMAAYVGALWPYYVARSIRSRLSN